MKHRKYSNTMRRITIIRKQDIVNFIQRILFPLHKVATTRYRNNANSDIQKFIEKRDRRRDNKIGSVPSRWHGMVWLSLIEQYVPLSIVPLSRSGS